MNRSFNFGAGPAMLPLEVMEQAQQELLNWHDTGMSIIEIGHRTSYFTNLLSEAEQDLRTLVNIPSHYRVLFMSNSTRAHFAMVPMNLLRDQKQADYFDTGVWSQFAMDEAKRYCNVHCVASAHSTNYTRLPDQKEWTFSSNAAYVHYTENETINGLEFSTPPQTSGAPLVVDMTSNFLSRPIDIEKFGIIYVGAQKNVGPSGLTIVIIHEELLNRSLACTPSVFDYTLMAETHSLYYTPNIFACYMAGLMFKWLLKQGGLSAMAEKKLKQSKKLYQAIDVSNFYDNPIEVNSRSRMNVPFRIKDSTLESVFLKEAEKIGLTQLQGHKLVGGLRASLYNAMPDEGVDALISFMSDFEKRHG